MSSIDSRSIGRSIGRSSSMMMMMKIRVGDGHVQETFPDGELEPPFEARGNERRRSTSVQPTDTIGSYEIPCLLQGVEGGAEGEEGGRRRMIMRRR